MRRSSKQVQPSDFSERVMEMTSVRSSRMSLATRAMRRARTSRSSFSMRAKLRFCPTLDRISSMTCRRTTVKSKMFQG